MKFICPVCGAPLCPREKTCRCEKGHSFDQARSGYWNFLMDSASHGHGDDKAMLLARRSFLSRGLYAQLSEAIGAASARLLPNGGVWVDAGCGEGYYTKAVLQALSDAGKTCEAAAFDVSKDAARMTAPYLKGRGVTFVASCYHIPLADEAADLVLSVFSPFAREEYARILRPGGFLIRAVPERDHLMELKEAVYETPRLNAPEKPEPEGLFSPRENVLIRRKIVLEGAETILSLFDMTPYARKTAAADREKLAVLERLETTFACRLLISAKKA